jgi:hypothetical protein
MGPYVKGPGAHLSHSAHLGAFNALVLLACERESLLAAHSIANVGAIETAPELRRRLEAESADDMAAH